MVQFERTITITLEKHEEIGLYCEALEVAADNAPAANPAHMELRLRRAVLSNVKSVSRELPAKLTLTLPAAGFLSTALEVIEEIVSEALTERGATMGKVNRAAALWRQEVAEGGARFIRSIVSGR